MNLRNMTAAGDGTGDAFGAEYLQRRLDQEFPLARHIGVVVESAHDSGLVLKAPFAPNSNYKGTAFGGSLFCIAVLTGWAWATRYLETHRLNADAVIQESSIRYLKPVNGEFRAALLVPSADSVQRFRRMLARSGRGRLRLHVDVYDGATLATRFDGLFAATVRTAPAR